MLAWAPHSELRQLLDLPPPGGALAPPSRPPRAPNMGLQVWLMTSRQTEPELRGRAAAGGVSTESQPYGLGSESAPFVHVWVEDFVDEANGRRLVGVRVRQLHVHAPHAALVGA